MGASGRYLFALRSLLLVASFVAVSAAKAERVHHYSISIDPDLTRIDVTVCFDGQPPPQLVAESLDATVALVEVRNQATGKEIAPSGHIPLKSVPVDGCLSYKVDVSRPINRHDRSRRGALRRIGNDLALSAGLWLWRPEELAAEEDVELVFELPEGISVSAPWVPVESSRHPPEPRAGSSLR